MKKSNFSLIFIIIFNCHPLLITAADEDGESGWVALFNGKNLQGWIQHNGTATYHVEDGAIVGRTSEGSPNSFLCTERVYGDFELKFEVKVDHELNSGVQIRSKSLPDYEDGRVHGPQVEISTNGNAGFIYGEALETGWLSKDRSDEQARKAFTSGQWNSYRVIARGEVIQTWVNGTPIANLKDNISGMSSGFIGLQVHSIKSGAGPFEVRWRNLEIRQFALKK